MHLNHTRQRAVFRALLQCEKFFELFAKLRLTQERGPNYIPPTGDDVASSAAVLWRLSSCFDFVHGHLAKSQAEDFVSLNETLPRCLTCKSEERETWTAVSLRGIHCEVGAEKRLSTVTFLNTIRLFRREAGLLSECVRDSSNE